MGYKAKILQIIPYFVSAWDRGGPLNVAYNLSKELMKRGHEINVYTTDILNIELYLFLFYDMKQQGVFLRSYW
jgi:hypothetical protein